MKNPQKTEVSAIAVSTEGQRLLRAVADSSTTVAARVGVSKAAAGHWRTGLKLPSGDQRRKLSDAYGIPVAAWDQRPGVSRPSGKAPARSKSGAAPEVAAAVAMVRRDRINTEAEASSRLAELQKLRSTSGLMVREVVQCISAEVAVLKVVREIQADEEMTESRIVASEPHQRLIKAVLAALEPYPDALRAVIHAMERRPA